MTYYTINIEITETLTPSQLLQEMKDGATRWGKIIGQQPTTRQDIQQKNNNYYMKVGYK